jgi:hypothetical protein
VTGQPDEEHVRMPPHLAELLLDARFRGGSDPMRRRHPFSTDIVAANAILFNRQYSKRQKIRAYRQWLETNQPCVFGKVAAKNKNVFICLLEENEILAMRRGDDDVRDTIQDCRQAWKRHALDGLSSSFLLVLVSPALVASAPDDRLKEIARRLLELYMEVHPITDDTILEQREYVFLRQQLPNRKDRLLKFSTLPNVFCTQGDGRWWHDHRTPGGLMITSNALGHFVYVRQKTVELADKDKLWALENAMRTIGNASKVVGSPKIKHCPATELVPASGDDVSPLRESSEFRAFSCDHYRGFFHTDHLVPSTFFHPERDLKRPTRYDDLSLRYIWDHSADHRDLMIGTETNWYEVRQNLDRLPDFANPEKTSAYPEPQRARLAKWLDERRVGRM